MKPASVKLGHTNKVKTVKCPHCGANQTPKKVEMFGTKLNACRMGRCQKVF